MKQERERYAKPQNREKEVKVMRKSESQKKMDIVRAETSEGCQSRILHITLTQKGTTWKFTDTCWDAFNLLKKVFITVSILTHWILDLQIIVKTNTSNYTFKMILSIITPDSELNPIAFHSHTFTASELNYNIYNKKLLAIFEAFCIWHYYLKGSALLIDMVTDYKNLEYFSTTKVLIYCQAKWSECLLQFHLIIHFCPG